MKNLDGDAKELTHSYTETDPKKGEEASGLKDESGLAANVFEQFCVVWLRFFNGPMLIVIFRRLMNSCGFETEKLNLGGTDADGKYLRLC